MEEIKMKKVRLIFIIVLSLFILLTISNALAYAERTEIGDFSGQCTAYVQTRVSSFTGVTTLTEKMNYNNDDTPKVGSVAIMTSSEYEEYGHVGYIEAVNGSQITITEANVHPGKITQATGTAEQLNIIGYYNPSLGINKGTVTFYEHINGEGWSHSETVTSGTCLACFHTSLLPFDNDQLSSVRISGSGITVELYQDDLFGGQCCVLTGEGLFNLTDRNFNDLCSSFQITR